MFNWFKLLQVIQFIVIQVMLQTFYNLSLISPRVVQALWIEWKRIVNMPQAMLEFKLLNNFTAFLITLKFVSHVYMCYILSGQVGKWWRWMDSEGYAESVKVRTIRTLSVLIRYSCSISFSFEVIFAQFFIVWLAFCTFFAILI